MDKYYIPQQLDVPLKVILWTLDEVGVFCVPFFISFLLFNSPLMGIFLGAMLVILLKRIKGEEGDYFLTHLAYWHLPSCTKYKATPHSYAREILG